MSYSIGIGKPESSNSIGIGRPKCLRIGQSNYKQPISARLEKALLWLFLGGEDVSPQNKKMITRASVVAKNALTLKNQQGGAKVVGKGFSNKKFWYIYFNKAFLTLENVGFKTNSITDPTRYFFL